MDVDVCLPIIQFGTQFTITWIAWKATVQPIKKGDKNHNRKRVYERIIKASFLGGLIITGVSSYRASSVNRQLQEVTAAAYNRLLPGDEPMPSMDSLGCHDVKPEDIGDDYFLQIGGVTQVVKTFPFSPMSVEVWPKGSQVGFGHDLMELTKSEDGTVVFSLDVRDSDGNILVAFDKDGFQVGPQLVKRHTDKSTLIVTDAKGTVFLKVEYLNKHYIRVHPHIVVDGQVWWDIPSALNGFCQGQNPMIVIQPHDD
ncbi:MAG TPA: hypothetical protein VND65_09415 [Candidatus Binatia bacterium]|nr:hypothetical protein [Candidatus Binatia bacterium]